MLEIFLSSLIVWAAFWEVGTAVLLKSHQSLGFLMTSIWGKFLRFLYSQIEMIYTMSLTSYVKHLSSERRNNSFKVTEPEGQDNRTVLFPQWRRRSEWHAHTILPMTIPDLTWMQTGWEGKQQRSQGKMPAALLLLKALVWPWQAADLWIIRIYQKEECTRFVLQKLLIFPNKYTMKHRKYRSETPAGASGCQ